MGLGDMAKKAKEALTGDEGDQVDDQHTARTGEPGPTDGVNAVGTGAGSEESSGNTTAGATSPGPDSTDTARRPDATGDQDADDGSQNPGPSDPRD